MLRASLCIFRGISPAAERRLWGAGILSWEDLVREGDRVVSRRRWADLIRQVEEADAALAAGAADYFLRRLPVQHQVRIWPDFEDRLVALDIETDGLGVGCRILMVGVGRKDRIRVYVDGVDLAKWLSELRGDPILVTFNGLQFDLPVLRYRFGMGLGQPHIDLRPVLRAHGQVGGQKLIEARCGITRTSGDLNGAAVPDVWRAWQEGRDLESIRRLVMYNADDVKGIWGLGFWAYRRSMMGYPLGVRMRGWSEWSAAVRVVSSLTEPQKMV